MVLSTAMPTLIAATVIVIISRGSPNKPRTPSTDMATKIFGINPMTIALKVLKIARNINPITEKTMKIEPI